jgi:hypothetical protein
MRKVFYFLLFFGILFFLSHLVYFRVYDKISVNRWKEQKYKDKKQKPKIWFMGDSHPLEAVDPGLIPGSFNWAASSENFLLIYFKIKYLLSLGEKPGLLVLPLEYHSFSAQGKALILNHELDDLYWRNKLETSHLGLNTEFLRWKIQAWLAPFAGQFYKLSILWKPSPIRLNRFGFQADPGQWISKPSAKHDLQSKLESHFKKYDILDSLQLFFLHQTLELAHRNGIQVMFIRYPISNAYLDALPQYPQIQKIEKVINQISKQWIVLDFREIYKTRQDYFADPDHLNAAGARDFSVKLAP